MAEDYDKGERFTDSGFKKTTLERARLKQKKIENEQKAASEERMKEED